MERRHGAANRSLVAMARLQWLGCLASPDPIGNGASIVVRCSIPTNFTIAVALRFAGICTSRACHHAPVQLDAAQLDAAEPLPDVVARDRVWFVIACGS